MRDIAVYAFLVISSYLVTLSRVSCFPANRLTGRLMRILPFPIVAPAVRSAIIGAVNSKLVLTDYFSIDRKGIYPADALICRTQSGLPHILQNPFLIVVGYLRWLLRLARLGCPRCVRWWINLGISVICIAPSVVPMCSLPSSAVILCPDAVQLGGALTRLDFAQVIIWLPACRAGLRRLFISTPVAKAQML